MQFAICNETFQDWPLEQGFRFAAECGYTAIEIAPFTIADDVRQITAGTRSEVRRQAAEAGLEIVALHWLLAKTEGLYVTTPEAEVRRRTADYFGHLARLCADLGGKFLIWGSPQQRNLLPDVSRDEAFEYAADMFRTLVPVLEETGVTVAIEPLGPEWTDFLSSAAEGVKLAEMIASKNVRLHLDCKAMTSESTPPDELIRRHGDMLVHVHANDPNSQGPGFGELNFVPIFRALREIDYQGCVSVEAFDYAAGVECLARQSLEYMHACLAKAGRDEADT